MYLLQTVTAIPLAVSLTDCDCLYWQSCISYRLWLPSPWLYLLQTVTASTDSHVSLTGCDCHPPGCISYRLWLPLLTVMYLLQAVTAIPLAVSLTDCDCLYWQSCISYWLWLPSPWLYLLQTVTASADSHVSLTDCDCHPPGCIARNSYCDPATGQCVCKTYTAGRRCERCLDGTYNLQQYNVFGCQGQCATCQPALAWKTNSEYFCEENKNL